MIKAKEAAERTARYWHKCSMDMIEESVETAIVNGHWYVAVDDPVRMKSVETELRAAGYTVTYVPAQEGQAAGWNISWEKVKP